VQHKQTAVKQDHVVRNQSQRCVEVHEKGFTCFENTKPAEYPDKMKCRWTSQYYLWTVPNICHL